MNPDQLQQAWQAHASQTRVTIDAELLRKEVQRSQSHFQSTIFWRDFREVGVALVMIPVWIYLGVTYALPWSWYLVVPAFVWGAGFMLVDRRRHKPQPSDPAEPLAVSVQSSLAEVEHQIWLLRHVFWWYLLPYTIPVLAFFAEVAWRTSPGWWGFALAFSVPSAFVLALYYLIYQLNQSAVHGQLEPRRQELLALLASLGDESAAERSSSGDDLRAGGPGKLKRWFIVLCLIFVIGYAVLRAIELSGKRSAGEGYLRLSPFAAVRWVDDDEPEVYVDKEWYRLVAIGDLPAEMIVDYSRVTYRDKWQKRFEEDLVELLSRMGHPPGQTVRLVVRRPTSQEWLILKDVPLTEENREAIKAAAEARANTPP